MSVVAALGSIKETSSRVASAEHASAQRVMAAIQKASQNTGVDFSYMLRKAEQESGLDATVKAKGSSATGLYQFVDQTWLRSIKAHGADYGYGALAEKITLKDGKATVADAATKKEILDLRNDPELSANLAAELAKDNKEALQRNVDGSIGGTELYLAHFLGSGGATQFLNTLKTNPDAKAAAILPTAAQANKAVFYNKDGSARSLRDIYASFDRKFDATGAGVVTASNGAINSSVSQNVGVSNRLAAASTTGKTLYANGAAETASLTSLDRYRESAATPYYPLATVASAVPVAREKGGEGGHAVTGGQGLSSPVFQNLALTTNFATLLFAQTDILPAYANAG